MITAQLKTRLGEIAVSPYIWANQRASYMLSIISRLENKTLTQTAASDWMWDVIRRLDEDAGIDDPQLVGEIKALARDLGELDF